MEILEFGESEYEYWQVLFDRIPSLPQKIRHDGNIIGNIYENAVNRLYSNIK